MGLSSRQHGSSNKESLADLDMVAESSGEFIVIRGDSANLQGRFDGCHTKRPCAIEHPLPAITPDSTTDIPSNIPHTPALEMPMHVMLVMAARRIGWHAAAQALDSKRKVARPARSSTVHTACSLRRDHIWSSEPSLPRPSSLVSLTPTGIAP